jgi:hypothetical protein
MQAITKKSNISNTPFPETKGVYAAQHKGVDVAVRSPTNQNARSLRYGRQVF